jgi:archaellum biogenesis ATPase FlaH
MSEIHEWAKKYRAIGWNVIPLFNNSKNPAPIQWKQYQERMATDEEFAAWFENPAVTGLGLITGKLSGIVVLDEDIYKSGGKRVAVRTGMMAETARGGKHHFFRYVEPIKSSGFREGINVEIKADGGFVVLPPSQVVLDNKTGAYAWVEKCHPDDLMEMREEMLTPYRGANGPGKAADIMSLVHAPLGQQHNNLRTFSLAVLNRFAEKEWDIAAEVIRVQASKFDPPHPTERIEKMIRDCMIFIRQHPKAEVEAEIVAEAIMPRSINELAKQRVEDRKLEAIAPSTAWPELDALIKGFIPGHAITFTGDTNVGKTTIACNWTEALRRQKKKTLYIALEPDVNVVEYLTSVRLRKRFDEVTDEDLFLEDEYVQVLLQDDVKTVQDLIQVLKNIKERHDLIVIDHIGYFVQSERDWIQQQSNVIKQLKFLAKERKSCVIMIAHLRKPGAKKKSQDWVPTQDDISGSAAFKQDSTEVLIAYRPTKPADQFAITFSDEGYLLVTKTKAGPNGSFPLIFSEKSAKVWSEMEALTTEEGKVFLTKRDQQKYASDMQASAPWMEKEVDTGNDD